MSVYSCYDLITGKVMWAGEMPDYMIPLQTTDKLGVIREALNTNTHYVDVNTETSKPRPPLPVVANKSQIQADGVDELVLSGVPVGSSVIWPDGEEGVVNDGEVALSVDLAGSYVIKIVSFPYLTEEFTVEAID